MTMAVMLSDVQIEELKVLAQTEAWDDDEDFVVDDYAGGNMDDAFYGGHRAGQIDMARQVLTMMGVNWE